MERHSGGMPFQLLPVASCLLPVNDKDHLRSQPKNAFTARARGTQRKRKENTSQVLIADTGNWRPVTGNLNHGSE
jgi:hypothetical protein